MQLGLPSADPSSRCASPRTSLARRRGVVVVWTLMFVALLVTILCGVVEIAHLYLARTELENALEAAALAGADYWAKNPTDPNDTLDARTVAMQYAAANTVDGQPVVLDLNYGTDDVNQNGGGDGNLIFGAVSFEPVRVADNAYAFDHDIEPSCTVTEVVEAEVDIPWKVQANDTYGTSGTFELEYWNFTPINPPTLPALAITKITYGLAGVGGTGLGRFDVDTGTPPANETNLGSAALSGWGPFSGPGGVGYVASTFTPTNPDGAPNTRYKTLEVVPATPLLPGNVIRFGVDTDMMDGTAGPTVVNTSDDGGHFYTSDFYMALEFNGDSANPLILLGNGPGVHNAAKSTFLNRGQSKQFSFTITRPGNGTYGVRAQANIEVTPWLGSFLGCPIGPFRVAARSTARAGCGAELKLVRIATDPYTIFPYPSAP